MSEFKVGDRVRRASHFSSGLNEFYLQGAEFEVASITDRGAIVDPRGSWHDGDFLELVTPAEPLPVRTVTRHEIVPGTYGLVSVGRGQIDKPDGNRIEVSVVGAWANAAELRASARVFVSLAEALEENG